jgi:hypothetical protein
MTSTAPSSEDTAARAVRSALLADSGVRSVELIGSRADGSATELSEWDYLVRSAEPATLASRLPALIAPLRPLGQLWDPLARTPVFMIVLPGAVKVDVFSGAYPATPELPAGAAGRLRQVDTHFWDWNLWLGAKRLRGNDELVRAELAKMYRHVLRPLGAASAPHRQDEAIGVYLELRRHRETQLGAPVAPGLGNAVIARLRDVNLLPPR